MRHNPKKELIIDLSFYLALTHHVVFGALIPIKKVGDERKPAGLFGCMTHFTYPDQDSDENFLSNLRDTLK